MPVFHTLRSLDFDGTNDFVLIGNVAALNFERTDPFSIAAWVKATASANELTIFGKQLHTGVNPGYRLSLSTAGDLFFELVNSSTATSRIQVETSGATNYKNGIWQHMCVTYAGTSLASGVTLYVDGNPMAVTVVEDTLGANSILTTAGVSLGSRNSASTTLMFIGRMDEVAVYDKELSAGEVTTIYNDGHPPNLGATGPFGDLVGYWYMGDGAVFPTIIDHASGNNGTMTNMVAGDIVLDAPARPEHHPLDYGSYTLEVIGPGIQTAAGHNAIAYGSYTLEVIGPGIQTAAGHNMLAYGGFPDYLKASSLIRYYKMRALVNPGPGYTTWVATSVPDFAGNQAPVPVQPGTIVLASKWTTDETLQQRAVPTVEVIETFSAPGTATNPGIGLTLALVQTNAVTWSDQDTILLPASPSLGTEVIVKDRDGNGAIKRITVDGNGALIDGISSRLMSTAWEALHVTYSGTAWSIV